jgi:DNA-binding NarL/FixJ family response regulator
MPTMRRPLKILIVDDHPLFRRGLRQIIEEHKSLKVIGEAPDGQAALELAAELKPEIIVVDLDMPRINGMQLARTLKKEQNPALVIFLTMYKDEDVYNAALDAGVKGYVLKENAGDDIIAALLKVAEGGTFFSSDLAVIGRRRDDRVQSLLLSKPQIDTLTPAERRILKLIAEDRTSKEIADVLNISVKTVENHRFNISTKLHIHGSHSLLKFAFDHRSYL